MAVTGRKRHCFYCGVFVGHIPEHPCQAFRTEIVLPDVPVDVIPSRTEAETAESMRRYRRSLPRG